MNEFRQIIKKVEKIEKKHGDFVSYVVASTLGGELHTMRMEEVYASNALGMSEVYQDLSNLELADLRDFEEFIRKVHGEFI